MTTRKWKDIRRKGTADLERENATWVTDQMVDMNLRAVRSLVGKTQKDMAELSGIAQGDVSEFERREDHLLSTLRRYVRALGGDIEVIARFDDKTIRLHGV